jgi:hypothetical protein
MAQAFATTDPRERLRRATDAMWENRKALVQAVDELQAVVQVRLEPFCFWRPHICLGLLYSLGTLHACAALVRSGAPGAGAVGAVAEHCAAAGHSWEPGY